MRALSVVVLAAGLGGLWPAAATAEFGIHQVGTSPSAAVVQRAPAAVSVTFDGALEADGVSMQIMGPDGDVSAAQPQVVGNAVRRELVASVPAGPYRVAWTARAKGSATAISGSFTFFAANGTGARTESVPGPAVSVTPSSAVPSSEMPSAAATVAVLPSRAPVRTSGSLAGRLLAVPLALVALLVLASVLTGLASHARRPAAPHRRLVLPGQRIDSDRHS